MGFLVGEMVGVLVAAAVVGMLTGWAFFGRGARAALVTAGGGPTSTTPPGETARLRGQLTALEAERDGLASALSERDEKIGVLEGQKEGFGTFRQQVTDELKTAEARIAELEAAMREAETAEAVVAPPAPPPAGRADEADASVVVVESPPTVVVGEEVVEETADAAAELAAVRSELAALAAKHAELEAENTLAEQSLDEQDGAIDQLTHDLARAQQRISHLEQEKAGVAVPDKDATIQRLQSELDGLRNAYADAEKSLDEQDGAIDQLTQELIRAQREMADEAAHADVHEPEDEVHGPGPGRHMASGPAPQPETDDQSLAVRSVDLPPELRGAGGDPSMAATLAFAMARLETVHKEHKETVDRLSDARSEAEKIRSDLREAQVLARVADNEKQTLAAQVNALQKQLASEQGRRDAAEKYLLVPWYSFGRKKKLRAAIDGK